MVINLRGQSSGPSHLERMTYEDLLELFNDFDGDSLAQERIARTYLERARRDGDTVKVARGYDRLARIFQPETNIKYADTLIAYTKDWDHITYPAMGYILKGYEFGQMNIIAEKYDNLTYALKIAKKNDNISQIVYLLGVIGDLRNKWGSVEKADELLKERHRLILQDDYIEKLGKCTRNEKRKDLLSIKSTQLINSYKSFVISNITHRDIPKARIYLDSLRIMLSNYNGAQREDYYWWVNDAEVELDYYEKNYENVIAQSENILNNESFRKDHNKFYNTLLFRGLSELEMENSKDAIILLDSVEKNKNVFGHQHNEYLKLLYNAKYKINEQNGNLKGQLVYLDKLLRIDSINAEIFKFIEPRMVYEMDAAKLINQKESLIHELNIVHKADRLRIVFIGSLLFVVTLIAVFYYRQKVIFKKRFESLLEKKSDLNSEKRTNDKLDLAPGIIEDILNRLDKFEKEKQFLDADITLNSLAKVFQTNSSYLSRVLNHHMEKNFSQYLNGLRVGYALERLKNHTTFRKYTIEAIAFECGYKNSASFSRAFYRITGIYPSYYINELNKIKE